MFFCKFKTSSFFFKFSAFTQHIFTNSVTCGQRCGCEYVNTVLQVLRGELVQMKRGAHPHMNNLVYGRRSAPSTDHDSVCTISIVFYRVV